MAPLYQFGIINWLIHSYLLTVIHSVKHHLSDTHSDKKADVERRRCAFGVGFAGRECWWRRAGRNRCGAVVALSGPSLVRIQVGQEHCISLLTLQMNDVCPQIAYQIVTTARSGASWVALGGTAVRSVYRSALPNLLAGSYVGTRFVGLPKIF